MTSYHFIFSFNVCFTKLLNAFFASIFRYRCYDRSRTYVVMCNADGEMFGEFTLTLLHTFLPKLFCPEGMGGVQNGSGNSEGVGRLF